MINKNQDGAFEFQDMFQFMIFGILLFVFIQIFTPISGLINFDGIANGAILELLIGFFSLIIAAGFVASYIKKWNTPGQ